ncbi:MAG: CDF family Co(II)/Ni(II) efflux transporter DmeF [Magnetospirillum sp.]|nr:CDF family Co(II)/Ni(II) efflux transporter DmeF [Magnetospirillum sp.]
MHTEDISAWTHPHRYVAGSEERAERRTKAVVALTVAMMVAEITAGTLTNSMALLADGWHMSTHALALGIAAFAYSFARRHADDPRFTFGPGKVGVLAAFTSAVILGMVALLMVWESGNRLLATQTIAFDDALLVAVLGLAVNVASALLLAGDHEDHHGHGHYGHDHHGHGHGHGHGHHHHDHNLRAAYTHVLADAFTSLLAIGALLCGKYMGWWWLDPAMGIVGAGVIANWAWTLLRRSGGALLDMNHDGGLAHEVRDAIEGDADNRVSDLHLWQVGPGHWAAIVSLVTHTPRAPDHYRALLAGVHELSHVTVEVHRCE